MVFLQVVKPGILGKSEVNSRLCCNLHIGAGVVAP